MGYWPECGKGLSEKEKLTAVGTVAVGLTSAAWTIWQYALRRRASLDAVYYMNYYESVGGPDPSSRAEVVLIFRNLSERPTAVVDVQVQDDKGTTMNGHGYGGEVELPMVIGPWTAAQAKFSLRPEHDHRGVRIVVADVDGRVRLAKHGLPFDMSKPK